MGNVTMVTPPFSGVSHCESAPQAASWGNVTLVTPFTRGIKFRPRAACSFLFLFRLLEGRARLCQKTLCLLPALFRTFCQTRGASFAFLLLVSSVCQAALCLLLPLSFLHRPHCSPVLVASPNNERDTIHHSQSGVRQFFFQCTQVTVLLTQRRHVAHPSLMLTELLVERTHVCEVLTSLLVVLTAPHGNQSFGK